MQARTLLLLTATLLIVATTLMACTFTVVVGSGRSVTETREVSDFDGVEFASLGDLTISQGEDESLTITGDDNIVPLIRTTVNNGVLRIDGGGATIGRTIIPLRYALTVRSLNQVNLDGLGNIDMARLEGDSVVVGLSGAGSLHIDDVTADNLAVNMSGLGDINLAGEVNKQSASVSGTGSYFARDLRSQTASVSLSGLGSAEIWATEELAANISGAGSIKYAGNPRVSQQVSGLGTVESLGDQ